MLDLPGFEDPNNQSDLTEDVKFKKKMGKGGGFQSMGLSFNVLKGITKRGYKIPTPIQRKTIPLALEGKNIVAMARTGSGKTACFLIPLFEKLKIRMAKTGARALILSPTRELAVQTLKFVKELGRFTDLKAALISGGDSMDSQFSVIHGNPDILIATPGRFLHICIEMDLKLNNIEYVVFDEADRLFEMGFGTQMNSLLEKLPDTRQTLLFSATLPKVLVEFAKAGIGDPVLIRLDVESKLPAELDLVFLTVRSEERTAALLVLLKLHIDSKQQTVVFAATKYHVDYLHMVLDSVGISNTYIYSSLDSSARKINTAKFSQHKVAVLIVTDVAARGLDIPRLDNVINYNFPDRSKLFVHRVGRCARAGRTGTAYSLITPDEYPYMLDLHLFLGQSLSIINSSNPKGNIGCIPQSLIEEQHGTIIMLHDTNPDLLQIKQTADKAYTKYLQTRPVASVDSNRRAKQFLTNKCGTHAFFKAQNNDLQEERENILQQMKNYRPQGTVFEVCSKTKSQDYLVMKATRAFHKSARTAYKKNMENQSSVSETKLVALPESTKTEIESVFDEIVTSKKRKLDYLNDIKPKKQKDEYYIPYSAPDKFTEDGMAINNFQREASQAQFDLTADTTEDIKRAKQQMRWDRKKKKMVGAKNDLKVGKLKTEGGKWIPASYKTYRYEEWKEKTKAAENEDNNEDDQLNDQGRYNKRSRWGKHNDMNKNKKAKSELRSVDQIVKQRKITEKKKLRQNKKLRKKTRK
ncbi:ATP-dependent RNA helicase DDX54-like [Photinus pyralis]|uniref:RNA helicase n=2 Tax=Photinus pyralis TaxID=7054 RepID=A0A1Y1LB33_PHOPY|nr:ATP-dependent RNA helicase DDX54-like [Photinus pyralis]